MLRLMQQSYLCLVCGLRFYENGDFKKHFGSSHVGEEDSKPFCEDSDESDSAKGREGSCEREGDKSVADAWVPIR